MAGQGFKSFSEEVRDYLVQVLAPFGIQVQYRYDKGTRMPLGPDEFDSAMYKFKMTIGRDEKQLGFSLNEYSMPFSSHDSYKRFLAYRVLQDFLAASIQAV